MPYELAKRDEVELRRKKITRFLPVWHLYTTLCMHVHHKYCTHQKAHHIARTCGTLFLLAVHTQYMWIISLDDEKQTPKKYTNKRINETHKK